MNLLYIVFFLTGATALVFESLWFHQAGLALGNSVWASSAVLSAFMAGLALGNGAAAKYGHRIARPVRLYAAAELTIGFVGAAIVFGLPSLGTVLAPVFGAIGVDSTVATNVLRFGAAFGLMLAPATMMGFTLPILTRALSASDPRFGRVLGRLYGFNTLGAVAGVLIAATWLVPTLGVPTTALLAAAANVVAAAAVLMLDRRIETPPPEPLVGSIDGRALAPFSVAAFGAGLILLALEVVWFRIMVWFVPEFPSSFALMLAVVLLGIALGGFLGARVESAIANPTALFALPLAAGFLGLCAFEVALWVRGQFAAATLSETHHIAAVALTLMLPTCIVSGVFFTALGGAMREHTRNATEATGLLTLSNTLGAALGSLLGGVLFLPLLGLEHAVLVLLLLYVGIALVLLPKEDRARSTGAIAAVAAGIALLFPYGGLERQMYEFEWGEVVAKRDGMSESIAYVEHRVMGEPREHWLVTNGMVMATNHHFARRYMELFAFLPAALHPQIENALLISFGTGQTARAMTEIPGLKSLDVVDISEDILEMSDVVFTKLPHPLRDPRVAVHVEDGRFFLQQAREQRFDLITAEPPPPAYAGVFALYSEEYFELVRSRLAPGGMVAYWLPVHLTNESGNLAIVRAFCNAFENCTLWRGTNACLTLLAWGDDAKFGDPTRLFEDDIARERLRLIGIERPEHLGALWIGGPEYLAQATAGVEPVTDDFPHRIPPADLKEQPIIDTWLRDVMDARERFAASALAREALGPLHQRSLAFFEPTDRLEDRLFANLEPLWKHDRTLEVRDVEAMLAADMRVGAMWAMGSDVDAQAIYDGLDPERKAGTEAQLHLGVRHFIAGDFDAAHAAFGRAKLDPLQGKRAAVLERYAAWKLGEGDETVLDAALPGRPQ